VKFFDDDTPHSRSTYPLGSGVRILVVKGDMAHRMKADTQEPPGYNISIRTGSARQAIDSGVDPRLEFSGVGHHILRISSHLNYWSTSALQLNAFLFFSIYLSFTMANFLKASRASVSMKPLAPAPKLFARSLATRATSYKLNTGAKIPALGFGTFQDPDSQEETVSQALQKGMRLIDTARVYNVEEQVGRGIKRSGVPRKDIFVGTKLWCNDYHPDDVERALDDSLRDLDTPYVDLLLMHYPCTFKRGPDRFPRNAEGRMIAGETTYLDTWKAMEKLTKTGKVKAIGVSNFSKGEIETLLNGSSTVR
jgi:hypothetical protein